MKIYSDPITVVIADDSNRVREHMVTMLTGMQDVEVVGEAEDAIAAIEQVQALRPQVAILDLQMPGGTGIRALRCIKRDFPETLVIILTNHADPFYRHTCLQHGANYFFDKTIEFEKVGEVLTRFRSTAA